MKAEVRWFDNRSGEGMIRILDETSHLYMKSIFVHYSAVDQFGDKTQRWVVLFPKQPVNVEVIEDYNWTQISKVTA